MNEKEKKKLYGLIYLAEEKNASARATDHFDEISSSLRECELRIDKYDTGARCQDKTLVLYTFKSDNDAILSYLSGFYVKPQIIGLISELLEDDYELASDEEGEYYFETKKVYDIEKLEFAPKHTFEHCEKEVISQLEKAEHSIFTAVAWLTNKNIMNVLIRKAREGVDVIVLVDQGRVPGDTKNYDFVRSYGRLPFLVFPCLNLNDTFQNTMHHKFCIIDNKIVVHGTFNWTIKGEYNDEDLTVDVNESSVNDFTERFKTLRVKYKKTAGFDFSQKFWG